MKLHSHMLAIAIAITSEAFKNKIDKQGKPYILHCLHVMNQMDADDPELQTIAVLHDLVEDIDIYTIDTLRELGFSNRVIIAVELLTHRDEVSYDDYIKAIAHNPDAKKVKKADLEHNSTITRLKELKKSDFDRLEKYHRSYVYLSD